MKALQTASATSETASAAAPSLAAIASRFPLPWSACEHLLSVGHVVARKFYEAEALRRGWSDRQLDRQINTQFHERVNHAPEYWVLPGENPPAGLILCASKGTALAHYALEGLPNKVMAAEYKTALPDEEVLTTELDRTQERLAAAKPDRKR